MMKATCFFISGKDRENHTGFSPLLRKIMQPAGRDEVKVINEIVKRNVISGKLYARAYLFKTGRCTAC